MRKNQAVTDIRIFLQPTKLINSQHPSIIDKTNEIINGSKSEEEKARRIFSFIRDEIRYFFRAYLEERKYYASQILKEGGGFCTQKAILFCAIARCCGIPAGIYFYDIIDHTLPENIGKILKTNILYHHAVSTIFISGKWIKYDATLDINLVKKNNLYAVNFFQDRDCLMFEKTRTGNKHIEYIKQYGLYSDISFSQISRWLLKHYSHLKNNM